MEPVAYPTHTAKHRHFFRQANSANLLNLIKFSQSVQAVPLVTLMQLQNSNFCAEGARAPFLLHGWLPHKSSQVTHRPAE